MRNYGNRVFFDQEGRIIHQTGEVSSTSNPHWDITEIKYVDIPPGVGAGMELVGINPTSKEPIFEINEAFETPEQKRIRELEDALLLQAENEIGGIL